MNDEIRIPIVTATGVLLGLWGLPYTIYILPIEGNMQYWWTLPMIVSSIGAVLSVIVLICSGLNKLLLKVKRKKNEQRKYV